jgi:hypothetical protein
MKKHFIILTGFIFCFGSTKAQNSFGLMVAFNNTSATKASEYNKTTSLNRFQIGFYGKHTIYKNWFLKGSVIYNQKGNFYDDTYGIADAGKKVTIKLNYAEASVDDNTRKLKYNL